MSMAGRAYQTQRVTTSQINNMHEAQQIAQQNELGETLLTQYKQCSQMNNEALRQAKNIRDLVQINVAAIDKQLYVTHKKPQQNPKGLGLEIPVETTYDFQFDPVNFRQKLPCMGDRSFLVNQAILLNSTHKNKVSETMNYKRFSQQHAREGRNHRKQFARTTKSLGGYQPPKLSNLPELGRPDQK